MYSCASACRHLCVAVKDVAGPSTGSLRARDMMRQQTGRASHFCALSQALQSCVG